MLENQLRQPLTHAAHFVSSRHVVVVSCAAAFGVCDVTRPAVFMFLKRASYRVNVSVGRVGGGAVDTEVAIVTSDIARMTS